MSDVERRYSHWVATILQSIGGTLIAILLVWIAGNQVTIITSQAVLQEKFSAQAKAQLSFISGAGYTHEEIKEWFEQIWPRLRAGSENTEILKSEIEDLCNCIITLNEPEPF